MHFILSTLNNCHFNKQKSPLLNVYTMTRRKKVKIIFEELTSYIFKAPVLLLLRTENNPFVVVGDFCTI